MPEEYIYETAITVDHEKHTAWVDTTVKAVATQLTRCGFEECGDEDAALPYRRFRGKADQIWFRLPKGQRKVVGAARRSLEAAKRPPRTPSKADLAA